MPVPQRFNFIVGWASSPPATGKMPVPQRFNFIVGWASSPPATGKMPVPHNIIAQKFTISISQ
jgi:hypothetical protein